MNSTAFLPVTSFKPQLDLDLNFGRYRISVASNLDELHQVLRLRHQVFFGSDEHSTDLDIDPFDVDAEHLMLWDKDLDFLVGTYRIRSSERVSEFYSQGEFAMESLLRLEGIKVELGRACIHQDYRNGACMALLWQGLAEALRSLKAKWVFGCSSISLSDHETEIVPMCAMIYAKHLSPEEFRVRPWRCLPELENIDNFDVKSAVRPKLPPLLKAYLNLGAWVCGKPAWDPEFNCVDFLTLLDVNLLSNQVARHFARHSSYV